MVAIPTIEAFHTLRPLVHRLLRDRAVTQLLILDNGHKASAARRWLYSIGDDPRVEVLNTRGDSLYRMWNDAWTRARYRGFDYLAVLNDDIVIPDGLIGHLAAALDDDPGLWLVAPEWTRPLSAGVDITGDVLPVRGTQRHGGISGWCFLVRVDVPVPPIDEQFEWWCGDDDLAEQVHRAGGRIGIVEGLPLDHEAETTARRHSWTYRAKWDDARRYEEKYGPGSAPPEWRRATVLLPTKDRPKQLVEAVDAILAQDWHNIEIVVQNGGKPVRLPRDPRILLEERPDNGIAHALNLAARRATGHVWHVACDDDVMAPGTLRSAIEALATSGYGWTYGWMEFYVHGPDGPELVVDESARPWPWKESDFQLGNCVHQPTAFFLGELYERLGPFNERFPFCWDYEWWGRLAATSPPLPRDHCDARYNIWPGSASEQHRDALISEVAGIHAMWDEWGFGLRHGEIEVAAKGA